MTRSKVPIIVGLVVVAIILVYAFQTESEVTSSDLAIKPLLIKTDPWPPFNILYVAQEKGIFEKNGVEVELDIQDYGAKSMAIYSKENFDGIMHAYTDLFSMNAIYDPSSVVYAVDFSIEGDFIISNVDSIEELKGKRVGVIEMYGFSYFFILKALQSAGLDENDVEIITVPIDDMLASIKSGEIDAGHSWNTPDSLDPDVQVIAYAGDYSGIITDVISFKNSSIEKNPRAIEALVRSYAEVIEYCKINESECARIISEEIGWSEEEVLLNFDSVQMLTLEDNLEIMTNFENPQSLYNSGIFISKTLYELKKINKLPDYDKNVDSRFVEKILERK